MGQDFTVTVYGERGEEFDKIFGTRTVNVRSPFPSMTRLGGNSEPESVYMLDVDLLTGEQRKKLVEHVAQKFSAELGAVEAAINALGMPIKVSDTVVTVSNPQKWLLDDDPNDTHEFDELSDLDDDDDGFGDYE